MTELLSSELVTVIATISSIVLAILTKKYKSQTDTVMSVLSTTSKKAEQFQKVINKLIDANEDSKISNEEFNGIVSAVKELVDYKAE